MSAIAAISIIGSGWAQSINPMTAAVLDGYEKILKENPKDYFTLYQRAAQYFRLSDYDKSLLDINKAIQHTPAKETEILVREYILAADIYIQLKDYNNALKMTSKALALAPNDYPTIYKHGNVCLYLKDYDEAKKSFDILRRNEPRSQEAYFGLAQVAVAKGEKNEIDNLLKQAENCNPSSYITYCRLGDIYTLAGEYQKAAGSYLSAFGLADDTSRPIQSLVNLADKSYQSVWDALEYAISKTDNRVPLYLLEGNIAYNNGRYEDALKAFTSLSAMPNGNDASVYDNLARSALATNNLQAAGDYADKALSLGPTAKTYQLKSEIELALGKINEASASATKAKAIDPNSPDAMVSSAIINIIKKNWQEALTDLNKAALIDPSNPKIIMLRAYIHTNGIKNTRSASIDLQRAASSVESSFPEALYKALAQTKSGKTLDGNSTIENALKKDSSPDALVYAAIYYANTNSLDKAKELRDKAISNGYANKYILDTQIIPGLDLSPIRK